MPVGCSASASLVASPTSSITPWRCAYRLGGKLSSYNPGCSIKHLAPSLALHARRQHRALLHPVAASYLSHGAFAGVAKLGNQAADRAKGLLQSKHDKEIWTVALPALAAMLLEPIMGAINSALIGNIGTQQLGAVSVGGLAVSFSTFVFSFLLFLTTPEVAAAVVKKDSDKASRTAAKGFWVAAGFGLITMISVILSAETIVKVMRPSEAAVAGYATTYIKIRAWGITASLLGFVATGTYRGFKDTRTPLYAALGSATTSLLLNYLFIYVFGWGVYGSGLATVLAQYVSCISLCVLLFRKGILRLRDLVQPPSLASVLPLLKAGVMLAARNIISFGMVMYASLLCIRAGSTYQASFEVVRQVWILTIQFFECLNVATQTLCAAYLGAGDRVNARAVMSRLLFVGVTIGATCGVAVFLAQSHLVRWFTQDPVVIQQVLLTLPVVCALFPLDAAASIMDGSLLAAKQTNYLSYVQIVGAGVQYMGLIYLANNGLVSALTVWSTLKLLTIFRVIGGTTRNFFSAKSGYALPAPAAS